jgi:hypothetical protein
MGWVHKRQRPRLLRKITVAEVSAVDRGAGVGCEVKLVKRHEEAAMSKGMKKCKACGGRGYVADDEGHDPVDKADYATVHKAVRLTHESIAKSLMAENPGMSLSVAMVAALDTAEFSQLHRDERAARYGF